MEKELIGCYVSGHPLDDYKKAFEKATVNSLTMDREAKNAKAEKEAFEATNPNRRLPKDAGKTYTAVGMIMELKSINTKKGSQMAFAKLQDYNGAIDLTFFPKTWESLKDKIHNDSIYAFRGKIDGSREQPSFLVDSIEDPQQLQERAIQEIHIQLENGITSERQIFDLKEFLFGVSGTCSIYLHVDTSENSYIIKTTSQLSAPATKEFLEELKTIRSVKDVWTA